MYFVIIGDIVDSKKSSNRSELQDKLNHILSGINESYDQEIASKFIITLGDEFQGVLHEAGHLLDIINIIESKLFPVAVRFGIGIGEITTKINKEMSLGADGPAYYHARKMINEIKEDEAGKMPQGYTLKLCSDLDENVGKDSTLNTIFSLCSFIKSKWSARQREMILDQLIFDEPQRKTAQRLGIAQSSVQRGLSSSGYYTYKKAMDHASQVINERWGS